MSTRGAYGYYVDGEEKIELSHSDSYPGGLGCDIVNYILRKTNEDLVRDAKRCVVWDKTERDEVCTSNSESLLGFEVLIDYSAFMLDGLFCEWAYVLNVDSLKLEIYCGFAKCIGRGRYNHYKEKNQKNGSYPGVALVAELPFDLIRLVNSSARLKSLYGDRLMNMVDHKANYLVRLQERELGWNAPSDEDIAKYFLDITNLPLGDATSVTFENLIPGDHFELKGKVYLKVNSNSTNALNLTDYSLHVVDNLEKVIKKSTD